MITYGKEHLQRGSIRDATQEVVSGVSVNDTVSSSFVAGKVFGPSGQRSHIVRKTLNDMKCMEPRTPITNMTGRPVNQYERVFAPTPGVAHECEGCIYAHHVRVAPRSTCIIYSAAVDEAQSEKID